jgi:hypothetical protein
MFINVDFGPSSPAEAFAQNDRFAQKQRFVIGPGGLCQ